MHMRIATMHYTHLSAFSSALVPHFFRRLTLHNSYTHDGYRYASLKHGAGG
jgi:hypothetical protein